MLDLTFIANPVVVIADHLANFGANALEAWFECLGDASLARPRREAIKHFELVGILERDVEMLRDVDSEGITANCHSTSEADGAFIQHSDIGTRWANIDDECEKVASISAVEHACNSVDIRFNNYWHESHRFGCLQTSVDQLLRHG